MYTILNTFDLQRVGKTYNKGEKHSLDELTGSEIRSLISNQYVLRSESKGKKAIKIDNDAESVDNKVEDG